MSRTFSKITIQIENLLVLPILVIGFYSFSLSVNIDILEFRSIIYTSIRKECFEMRVGQNIKTIAEAKRISIKELSRMVGIPYTTLYNMVNRNTDRFDLGLLEDIAHSLDVPIGALLESGELSLTEILGSHYSPSSNTPTRTRIRRFTRYRQSSS